MLVSNLLEVREVETESIRTYERALLLNMITENLLQSIVEKVGCCVVGSTCITKVCINASHEWSRRILWHLLYDMNALAILTTCVDDVDGLVL